MGKRKHNDDLEYIEKKIRKLEKKLKKHNRRDLSSSSDSDEMSHNQEGDTFEVNEEVSQVGEYEDEPRPSTSFTDVQEIELITNDSRVSNPKVVNNDSALIALNSNTQPSQEPPSILDNDLMELLGEDPSIPKKMGKDIQNDLAIRFKYIVINGLSKDNRKELLQKYPPPGNCAFIDAPALNPEMKAAVTEVVSKRDSGIELKQKQLGCAISGLGEAISLMMSRENKDTDALKILMDASRLLCDCQYNDSMTRRNFVLFNLKKDLKDQITKTKIDKCLFGTDLAETIRTAKTITKSGTELKNTQSVPVRQQTDKGKTPLSRNNLNWKAPPLNRSRPQGTQRSLPAYKSQQMQRGRLSRHSQRQQPPSSSSRTRRQ